MAGKTLKSVRNGQHLVVIGLLVQILFFGFFVVVSLIFNSRINKAPTARSSSPDIPWRKHMRALYIVSLLIMVRSIFRVIEYIQGNDGYILRHEIFLYIFDSVLMMGVMVIFNIIHPSEIKALLRGGTMSKGVKLYKMDGAR